MNKVGSHLFLNPYMSRFKFICLDELYLDNPNEEKFHIYFILSYKSFTNYELTYDFQNNRFELSFYIDKVKYFYTITIKWLTESRIISNHSITNINKDSVTIQYYENFVCKEFVINMSSIFQQLYKANLSLPFNVLYIGQSYSDTNKDRHAKTRLREHSTLQKIHVQKAKETDLSLAILLMNFEQQSITHIGPTTDEEHGEKLKVDNHFFNAMEQIKSKQLINITEAGLINVFKPVYNDLLKSENLFRKKDLKLLEELIKFNYDGIVIEILPEYGPFKLFTNDYSFESKCNHTIKFKLRDFFDNINFLK